MVVTSISNSVENAPKCRKCFLRHNESECSIQSFDHYLELNKDILENFNLGSFMQYSHSHVYMEDWGVVLNIPNKL